ncbi:SprT-like protease [Mycobacterium phage Marcoliusprime]|uniref:SprT-like protease n=1 Tax=Mycobacterium phage Findley TaxID=2015882 RepID=A0A222ZRR4_9CAUD|nr:SprT-like protein [Mycobacterium phage Milly]YP_009951168.1 SprT-like protease [Mycobacterium phage Findley]AOZ64418.1 SprT-like protease [Mycobacterium phage Marcoliusprime]ASR86624.1 SprT-like protease [Mycobacterium phage DismalFunk]AYB69034.1 SprT-like protease [Mycobacterium phage DismalStressor]AJA43754.1 SprT-like protease [Mycobacterium phage Milly]ASR86821.1 SprT-like protease [Mycobacterium phage Findley]
MQHMTLAQARQITMSLIREHGLTGWTVRFDNARRRAGVCSYRDRTIGLSKPLMAQRSYDDTMMTITHELAHALVGPRHGHDAVWAAKHRSLGGNGKRCFEHFDESAPWIGTCGHGKQFARYRAPKRLDGWRCRCSGGGSPITWQTRAQRAAERVVTPARKVAAPAPAAAQVARTIVSRPVGRGQQLGLF